MKAELIQLWKDYKKEFKDWEDEIFRIGGTTGRKPDMEGFIDYLECGYVR